MTRLGDLIDRLVTVDVKLYHVQNNVHAAARAGEGVDAATIGSQVSLNMERNRLMTEIEMCVDDAIKAGALAVDARVKL